MMIEYMLVALLCLCIVLTVVILILVLSRRNAADRSHGAETLLEQQRGQVEKIQNDIEKLTGLFLVPHTRGSVGETLLENLLRNWLPGHAFSTQYSFQSGARVDAVVRLGDYLVPIDAKFPLESLRPLLEKSPNDKPLTGEVRRAVSSHIDSIAGKYIRPREGTLHFALMYIPSERIYYHLFVETEGQSEQEELLHAALSKGVVPVSPSNLFLYLQTVAYGFQGFATPEKQRELLQIVYQLKTDFSQFVKSFSTAGNHLKNLSKAFDDCRDKVNNLAGTIDRLERCDK